MTTTTAPGLVEPLHGVTDDAKYRSLIASMETGGWTGAPIVIVDREDATPLAVTGSHRLAAAEYLGVEVPTVQLRDVFAAAGVDYDATLAELLDGGWDLYDALVRATDELPTETIDYYGLDAH